ncbi:MAG: dTMP kinase [Elusimicrobia bacterium]|nr:dTMP kinase [Elusimicrobiota bacterium]
MKRKYKGFFITLEGPDGCGKTTQSKLLKEALMEKGFKVLHTREPGGTFFAEDVRRIILNPDYKISPLAELLLYEASRAQHTEEVIRPGLEKGECIICERYGDATIAYQGYGRGIALSLIEQLNSIATENLIPDLTIVLDIPAEEGLRRIKKMKGKNGGDRLELESLYFHQRVRKGYFAIAKKNPKRVKILSAKGIVKELHQKILKEIESKIK